MLVLRANKNNFIFLFTNARRWCFLIFVMKTKYYLYKIADGTQIAGKEWQLEDASGFSAVHAFETAAKAKTFARSKNGTVTRTPNCDR